MCGIFGINIGKNKEYGKVEKLRLHSLGCSMDTRGGDSYGIYFDGKTRKSVRIPKYENGYKVTGSPHLPGSLKGKTIIGHTRRASPGMAVTEANCQPIEASVGKDSIVIAHNGTLKNHDELATKYNLSDICIGEDIDSMSDSMILARLILIKGFKILEEYTGAASLMMEITRDGKTPEVFVYSGKSRITKHSAEETIERPLHYVVHDGNIYICSLGASMNKLGFKDNGVQLEGSNVFKLDDGRLMKEQEIDRSNSFQREVYAATVTRTATYDRSSNYGYGAEVNRRNMQRPQKLPTNILLHKGEDCIDNYISFTFGCYHYDNKPCNGVFDIDTYGTCFYCDDDMDFSDLPKGNAAYNSHRYYFLEGQMIIDEESFIIAGKLIAEFKRTGNINPIKDHIAETDSGFITNIIHSTDITAVAMLLATYSNLPVTHIGYVNTVTGNTIYDNKHSKTKARFFTGEVKYPFTDMVHTFNNGDFKKEDDTAFCDDTFYVLTDKLLVEGGATKKLCVTNEYGVETKKENKNGRSSSNIANLDNCLEDVYLLAQDSFTTTCPEPGCESCFYEDYPQVCVTCVRNSDNINFDGIELEENNSGSEDAEITHESFESIDDFVHEAICAMEDTSHQCQDIPSEKAMSVVSLLDEAIAALKSIMLN